MTSFTPIFLHTQIAYSFLSFTSYNLSFLLFKEAYFILRYNYGPKWSTPVSIFLFIHSLCSPAVLVYPIEITNLSCEFGILSLRWPKVQISTMIVQKTSQVHSRMMILFLYIAQVKKLMQVRSLQEVFRTEEAKYLQDKRQNMWSVTFYDTYQRNDTNLLRELNEYQEEMPISFCHYMHKYHICRAWEVQWSRLRDKGLLNCSYHWGPLNCQVFISVTIFFLKKMQ